MFFHVILMLIWTGNIWRQKSYKNESVYWESEIESEAVARNCSVKMVFLKISQVSQENTCVKVSFFKKKLQASSILQLY